MAKQIVPNTPGLPSVNAIEDAATRQFASAVSDALAAQQQQQAANVQVFVTKDRLGEHAAELFRSGLQMSKSAFDSAVLDSAAWRALSERIRWVDNTNSRALTQFAALEDGFTTVRAQQAGLIAETRAIKVSTNTTSAGLIEEVTARVDSQSAIVDAINASL